MTRRHLLFGLLIIPWIEWWNGGRDMALTTQQVAFLKAYTRCGTVNLAAFALGIAPRLHYEWGVRSHTYVKAFAGAELEFVEKMTTEIERHVFQRDAGGLRSHSDALLIFLAKRLPR